MYHYFIYYLEELLYRKEEETSYLLIYGAGTVSSKAEICSCLFHKQFI